MKRHWKPLDLPDQQRLYEVEVRFPGKKEWGYHRIVAANSPSHAASLVEREYREAGVHWRVEPTIKGKALNVLQPEKWQGENWKDVGWETPEMRTLIGEPLEHEKRSEK